MSTCLQCIVSGSTWCYQTICSNACPLCPSTCPSYCKTTQAECLSVPTLKYCPGSEACTNATNTTYTCADGWVYSNDDGNGSTKGPIIGAAVGIVCIVLMLGLLVWHLRKIRLSSKAGTPNSGRNSPNSGRNTPKSQRDRGVAGAQSATFRRVSSGGHGRCSPSYATISGNTSIEPESDRSPKREIPSDEKTPFLN